MYPKFGYGIEFSFAVGEAFNACHYHSQGS